MSVTLDGIRFNKPAKKRPKIFVAVLAILEIFLSVFLYISLAAHTLFPVTSRAATGVAQVLSYQGRLTDSGGNALGGTGTNYCFRFSIYDSATSGSQLWPSGTPKVSTSTVTDGVFNALIGEADTLTYNFYDNDTVYLNVEATSSLASLCYTETSFESLTPRQRIAATGYAISSANVYGSLLKTDSGNSKVQLGTGAGVASDQILLGLDVKNSADYVGQTCTPNGSLWYNSATSRALVCEGGTMKNLSNATSTIAAIGINSSSVSAGTAVFSDSNNVSFGLNGSTITASATMSQSVQTQSRFNLTLAGNSTSAGAGYILISSGVMNLAGGNNITLSQNGNSVTIIGAAGGGGAAISAAGASASNGTIVFSNANNVSFGMNGSTITASVNAGGGGGAGMSYWANLASGYQTRLTPIHTYSKRPLFNPVWIDGTGLIASRIRFLMSRSAGTSLNITAGVGIYTIANSSVLNLAASTSAAFSLTTSAQWSGIRAYDLTGLSSYTIPQGPAVIALYFAPSGDNTAVGQAFLMGASYGVLAGFVSAGTNQTSATNATRIIRPFWGAFSVTTNGGIFPATVGTNSIIHQSTMSGAYGINIFGQGY